MYPTLWPSRKSSTSKVVNNRIKMLVLKSRKVQRDPRTCYEKLIFGIGGQGRGTVAESVDD